VIRLAVRGVIGTVILPMVAAPMPAAAVALRLQPVGKSHAALRCR
jgi:hypothetical protein